MIINPTLSEWLNLFARWFHVFAGMLWIGTTYFFTWLDGRFSEQEKHGSGSPKTQVWMVHSGGFYVVEKEKQPGPLALHWFRWEAAFTWASGMVLLFIVYYLGGALIDRDVLDIGVAAATAIGLGVLVLGWIVYDLLALSVLVRKEMLFGAVGYVLLVATTYGLTKVFSGRGAYMHIGALMGTIMAANVWMRILPAQRKMIAATKEGKPPDQNLAAGAKLRSKHNTFMVVPVVFIMISNHFPGNATRGYHWSVLAVLILLGWIAAKIIRGA